MRVVFILSEYSLHNDILSRYLAARPEDSVAVVKVPLVIKGKSRTATAKSLLPKMSMRFVGAKLLEFLSLFALTLMPKLMQRGAVFQRLRRIAVLNNLSYLKTSSVMSEETLGFIREQNPDLIVTLFHQIIKQPLIGIPRLGVLNIHPGLLPEFRGIQPYFWQLAKNFRRSGATLHLIEDEGVDTGRLLARGSYATIPQMSVQLNYFLTARTAAAVLPRCVALLERGELRPQPQSADIGGYYRWPDTEAVNSLVRNGHPMISLRDLWWILSGRFDAFVPDSVEFFQ